MESATCCGMESAQRAGWNHGNAVYGIKPQELYSIRASRNAMRDFVGIGEADLISSEAKTEDFIRACEDFIEKHTRLRLDLFAKV